MCAAWKEGIWAVFRLSWYFFLLLEPHLGDLGHLLVLHMCSLPAVTSLFFFFRGGVGEVHPGS